VDNNEFRRYLQDLALFGFVFAADGLKAYFMELGAGKLGSFGVFTYFENPIFLVFGAILRFLAN